MKKYSYIYIALCTIMLTGCIPFNSPAKPTGLNNIGTQSIEILDSKRLEWFTDNQDDYRRIMIQVWYPTKDEQGEKELYIDHGDIRSKALADYFGYKPFLFKNLTKIKTNSFKNAKPNSNQKYPLIIFSHGLGGFRSQNTIMVEELASHGYVVIGIEHAYDANVSVFNNGDIADYRSDSNYEERNNNKPTPEEFWALRLPQLKTRSADVGFVLDEIENRKLPQDIIDIIDFDNIGVFGHSFGGATSIYSAYFDSRIDACINLDGWMVPVPENIINDGISQDFMYIGQQKWNEKLNYEKLNKFIESNISSSKILIPGTTHYDYSDTPYMSNAARLLKKSGELENEKLKNILNELILSFFNKNLKDKNLRTQYYELASKHEISMIIEEYRDQ